MIIISNDLFVALRDERYFFIGGIIFVFYIFGRKDCLFKDKKSIFKCMKCNVYFCIGKEGFNCFYDYYLRL